MKMITKTRFCPAEWKNARTILLYKEGERSSPGNWRPITVTNVIYRAIFCRVAQAFHEAHEVQGISKFDIEQKGFVPGRAGCVEHAAIANTIINDAVEKKKQLYILSLDLRDAFGSIPHDLIEENLTGIGTPKELIKLIMNTYNGATIQMQTKKGFTYRIEIGKGVKQGCPLSSSLFNLGIDPLIRNIRKKYQERGYEFEKGKRKVIQAYADDLLVFSDTREHLNALIEALVQFMRYAYINFNPKKRRILIHNAEKLDISPIFLPDAEGDQQTVEIVGIKDVVKYLGVPLSTRKLQKMKFNKYRIEKTMKILERLRYSGLKIPQIIDAIRRFILPRLDYTMMNSIIGITELDKLDKFIRNMVNEMIGGPALSKDMFYTATKNGGLGLRLLTER